MHQLQKHIMNRLITNPELRYAQIKPAEVEGNLFMYHLRQLMKMGLVEKTDDGRYRLSSLGQVYADHYSLKTFAPRAQPRIVTLLAINNDHGQWLLYRRKRQPLIGFVGFPYGKLHLGEAVAEAADRELKEKTGLSAELTHRGDGYITIYRQNEPVSQIMFHLFSGHNPTGRLTSKGSNGEAFWSDLASIKLAELIPSVLDLRRLVETEPEDQRFFFERNYQIK